jgi:organic hydroperoxide reductase OsmC/OhrA
VKKHEYQTNLTWTGNQGEGTKKYNSYTRDYTIEILNKTIILGSSDPAFLGDANKHNPEDLLVSSISSCHMLWFLHLASTKGIVVVDYSDKATGVMIEQEDGSGYFESVTLNPIVTITDATRFEETNELHQLANKYCFISNSLNFKVKHHPICQVVD